MQTSSVNSPSFVAPSEPFSRYCYKIHTVSGVMSLKHLFLLCLVLSVWGQSTNSSSSSTSTNSSGSASARLSTSVAVFTTTNSNSQTITTTSSAVVTITASSNSSSASSNSNGTSTTTPTTYPTASASTIDGGGGTDAAPDPGQTGGNGKYGPGDGYIAAAGHLIINTLLITVAGMLVGGGLVLA